MGELSLHDAIYSLRAMRRLRRDPVSDEDLAYIVDAATQAPSASNTQPWRFVVVTDPGRRARIGDIYRRLAERHIRDQGLESGRLPPDTARVYRRALAFAGRLGDAPALILACVEGRAPSEPAAASAWYGSIYPAIQNLMLAARARGLGTVLTTLHKAADDEVKAALDIPGGVETVALIPVGHPEGRWDRPRRRASSEVTYRDRWGS